ncbi:hypothetical protein Cni_G24108 [Canna indica]|uniref:Uncharacterized protein n=1 Tax=Canna indica TaxID=4628 RepID=A0AAQ3KUC8_9LILI|nr:hypothetical protein Cni_G24108 [Canna indica]
MQSFIFTLAAPVFYFLFTAVFLFTLFRQLYFFLLLVPLISFFLCARCELSKLPDSLPRRLLLRWKWNGKKYNVASNALAVQQQEIDFWRHSSINVIVKSSMQFIHA